MAYEYEYGHDYNGDGYLEPWEVEGAGYGVDPALAYDGGIGALEYENRYGLDGGLGYGLDGGFGGEYGVGYGAYSGGCTLSLEEVAHDGSLTRLARRPR